MKSDIVITLPATIDWNDYRCELDAVANEPNTFLLFKIPSRPIHEVKGMRCYVCWRNAICGWMTISHIEDKPSGFLCGTTQKIWSPGYYLARNGKFNRIEPIPMKGFRGYRYIDRKQLEEK